MTAKVLCQDDSPWWPPEGVSCPGSWRLPSWTQPSLYSEVTHLDDHLKEFLVLEVEDSRLDQSQVSTLRWLTLMTTWSSFLSWKLRTPFLNIDIRQVSTPRWLTLMTTWKSFFSWKLRSPFLITVKSLLWGDSPWWPTEEAKGAYMTAKMTHIDDQLKKLKELIWQPSFYAKMTHLDDHLKEFLVLKAEDSLPDSQVSTLMWHTLMTKDLKKLILMTAKVLCHDDPPWYHLKEFHVLKDEDSLLDQSQVSAPRWLTLMTTWRSLMSWKMRTLFLIRAKSLLRGDSPWWSLEGS